jgi:type IV pilus assembly protein PilA
LLKKYCDHLKILILQNLLRKNDEQGFTILFVLIFGMLSAIALPSFLNQATKARQSEGKTYVGSMNRAQQAYQLENNAFTDSLDKLGLGIRSETESYSYSIRLGTQTGINQTVFNYGTSKRGNLKSYVGGVFVVPVPNSPSEYTTQAILCETDIPTNTLPSPPTNENGVLTCSLDTKQIGK